MKKNKIFFILPVSLVMVLFAMSYAQTVELKFSHKLHSETVGAECSACHEPALTSVLPTDNLLPSMETCFQCHAEDSECSLCHQDPDNAIEYPRIIKYIAKFPHEKHISNNIECSACHADVAGSEDVMASHLPSMQNCTKCHSDMNAVNYCYQCHGESEDLSPADHKANWIPTHGTTSYTMNDQCKTCHTDNQCLDCHQGDNLDHQVHPLNFMNNHAIDAKNNNDKCFVCHEEQSFCRDCHNAELVLPRNHSYAGWSNSKTGGSHKIAAKLDFDSCLSCHNDTGGDPVCAQCHTTQVND